MTDAVCKGAYDAIGRTEGVHVTPRALPSEVVFKLYFVGYLIVYRGEAKIHEGRHFRGGDEKVQRKGPTECVQATQEDL